MSAGDISAYLGDRAFDDWRALFDRDGYVVFPGVLGPASLERISARLAPLIAQNVRGRNDFEGVRSNRIYAMLAKSPDFAELVIHPLLLTFVDADLGSDCLLSACLAINLLPGETVQPWHYDDSHYGWPRPRPSLGVSAFWAISETTESNGATEVIPGSHLWGETPPNGAIESRHFDMKDLADQHEDPGAHRDAIKVTMPAGSLMIAKGTLWHRGGANRSDAPRLIVTPQYCPGWTRQLENMALAVPPAAAKKLPVRARELLGYSIHAPFMGYVDGRHPRRLLED